ncbi:hypothetical protein VARIO8X_120220 [Burkholderiales bacterium 8X]|nr:hypothetical protein VARIO8X_120220 [Burkholderiales bacterium 8X]
MGLNLQALLCQKLAASLISDSLSRVGGFGQIVFHHPAAYVRTAIRRRVTAKR